jgi:hypothetical protein
MNAEDKMIEAIRNKNRQIEQMLENKQGYSSESGDEQDEGDEHDEHDEQDEQYYDGEGKQYN